MKRSKKKLDISVSYIFVFIAIMFMSVGYAALNEQFSISGEAYVRADADIRIDNIKMVERTYSGYEQYNPKYTKDTTKTFVLLPNNQSTVTYEVTITNKTGRYIIVNDIIEQINDNENINYEIELQKNYIYFGDEIKFNIICTNLSNEEQLGVLELRYDIEIFDPQNKLYKDGTAIYFNPIIGKMCNDYKIENSNTNNKEDCMKWYIFNDSTDKTKLTMILDHNTTASVSYNSTGNSQMKEVKDELDKLTSESKWIVDTRLITADEIAKITKADMDNTLQWSSSKTYSEEPTDLTTQISWFYLDGRKNQNINSYNSTNGWQKPKTSGKSDYSWLYNYTNNCTSYGCTTNDSSNQGYWTSTSVTSSNNVWLINSSGALTNDNPTNTNYGVRPVIEVQKANMFGNIMARELSYDNSLTGLDCSTIQCALDKIGEMLGS